MNKSNITLLLLLLKLYFYASLTNIKIYGGNYGNTFKYIISGTAESDIKKSSNIPIKILIENIEKISLCSVENIKSGEIALYSCIYEGNLNGTIKIKVEQDNISGIEEEENEIKPFSLSIKYIEGINIDFENEIWEYDIKGEISGDEEIPIGSLSYMDIKVNNTNKLAGCIFNSKIENQILFNCKINSLNQAPSDKIIIPTGHTSSSTLKFSPVLSQEQNFIVYKNNPFIEGKDLFFNTGNNKWEFSIIVPYQSIPVATKSKIDILYNGDLSSADCFTNDNSNLDCIVNKETQNNLDLVKIHFIPSEISTISWNNLTQVYEIPIKKELKYVSSYDLKYTSTNIWQFKIKIEENVLPDNSLITINIKLNNQYSISKCYHMNTILNCRTENIKEEDTSNIKISYERNDASITWENIINDDIPITITASILYENSYDLTFTNNKWIFILKASSVGEKINNKFPISIKIKIGEDKDGIAYCYPIENKLDLYNCESIYEEQNENDLIIINGQKINNEVSVIWSTNFELKKITLLASLHYINAYDLMYIDDKWNFKIKTSDILPDGSKLVVDILYDKTNTDTATCIYHDKILSCTRDSINQSPKESLILKKEKRGGSITWEDMELSEIKMPLTISKNLIKAYGLFFSDNWNFYLDVEYIGLIPDDSYFIIDILHNNVETTAICELSNKTQSTSVSIIFCHFDAEGQSRKDEIRISTTKKEGSINFSSTLITEVNNTITEVTSDPTPFYISGAEQLEFDDIDNIWTFTLFGNIDRYSFKGEIFKIDVQYILLQGEYDSLAKCWSKGALKGQPIYFLCNVEYPSQTNEGLIQIKYFQSENSTLIWNGGISKNYQITIKRVSLILIKAYDLTLDITWKFKISVQNGVFPSGSRIIIDIIIGTKPKALYCNSLNSVVIICDSGTSSKTDLIKISNTNISESGVIWTDNLQPDYLIFTNIVFEYVNVYNLYFDININIWIFLIKKKGDIPFGSKFIVDIKYNNEPSIAICYNNVTEDELNCYVEKKEQNKKDLVQLYHVKTSESSITWINLSIDEKITLVSELTFVKGENLRRNGDKYWIFEIYITDEDIPNYSKFIIDIYYKINSVKYDSFAECYFENKILSCTTKLKTYELVTIKLTKKEGSVTWRNKNEYEQDNIPMVITTSLKYANNTKITYINNNYYFYIYLDESFPQEGEVIIDVEIGSRITTSICIAETISKLKCRIKNEDYVDDTFVYLISKNTEYSTVTWENLEKKIQLNNNINLEFLGAFDKKSLNSSYYGFKILTNGNNLNSGTEIYVRINYVDSYGNIIDSTTVPCYSENEFLICSAPKKSGATDFNIILTSSSSQLYSYENVLWTNGNNQETSASSSDLNLNFEINSFSYNNENNCYEFSFEDEEYHSGKTFFVTDITIGTINTYAYCNYINTYFNCKTSKIDYNEEYDIKISSTQTYGSVSWNNINENKKISNLFFVDISQIYNLHFEDNKWKFSIKTDSIGSPIKTYTLDVLISGSSGLANCIFNNGILECTVDSVSQNANSLIKLNYNINGDIKFLNLGNTGIPLVITLEFIKIYDLSYNPYYQYWTFYLDTKKVEQNKIIPTYSIFTLDLKYDNYNCMAVCSNDSAYSNYTITVLSCQSENSLAQNYLISLNNNKSEYSSIIWYREIPDNLEYFITTELHVNTVNNLKYDRTNKKWSFEMNLNSKSYYYYNYPLNSKVKIDLIYEKNRTTATCTFKDNFNYKFICIPNVENQLETDYFEINKGKKEGTVTFSNNEDNLIILFSSKFTFIKAYDLTFNNNHWQFKLKVSNYNLPEKRSTMIDFIENKSYKTAICTMANGILECRSLDNDYSSYPVYLTNKYSSYVDWTNLNKDEPIYVSLYIILQNVFGCFMENKWKFNIKYQNGDTNYRNYYYNNHVLLDILVNNIEKTALCEIFNDNVLKCTSSHNNQNINDKIEIIGNNEPNLGTVYFKEDISYSNRQVKPVNITIYLLKITSKLYSYKKLYVSIIGYLYDYYSYNSAATMTEIEIYINKTSGIEISRASCEITYDCCTYEYYENYYGENGVLLYCSVDNQVSKKDFAKINVDSYGNSKYVKLIYNDYRNLTINTSNYYDNDNYIENDYSDNPNSSGDKNGTTTNDNSNITGKIIGGVIGGVAGLGVLGVAIYVIKELIFGRKIVNVNNNNNIATINNIRNINNNNIENSYNNNIINNNNIGNINNNNIENNYNNNNNENSSNYIIENNNINENNIVKSLNNGNTNRNEMKEDKKINYPKKVNELPEYNEITNQNLGTYEI